MYQLNFTEFTQEEFLRDYWQKRPVVIRQGFVDFEDPICADEMAGLAMEEQVESRLVSKREGKWQADFGPFESYDHLGERDWSLVLQALDHWSEDAAKLIEPFRFIPNWRLDDIMASFATPGGGVGPHIDLYDVFICQGSGMRSWRVGDKGEHKQFAAHSALLHVEAFDPIIEVDLEPGDILYIPPGFPHDGTTNENSLSFSVGFRTNSTANLASGIADYLIDAELGNEMIEDLDRKIAVNSGAIDTEDYALIKGQMQQLLNNDELFRNFAGSYLTQSKHELDLVACDPEFTLEDLSAALAENNLMRLGGLRAFYFSETLNDGICYVDGTKVCFDPIVSPAVQLLCDNVTVTPDMLAQWHSSSEFLEFLLLQINTGYWYFSE
jgi:50S ribosomal protein L16 3-hydroxylase